MGKKESSNGEREGKYRVNFIGDKTYQDLHEDKLADFVTNYVEYSKIKKKVWILAKLPNLNLNLRLQLA